MGEAFAAGGGAFAFLGLIAWLVHRPERRQREVERYWRHVAEMELENYGEVRSLDAEPYAPKPIPPSKVSRGVAVREEDVRAFRALVAECEEIKTLIQQRERLDKVRADLGVEGYKPDPRVAELLSVLEVKRKAMQALTDRFVC